MAKKQKSEVKPYYLRYKRELKRIVSDYSQSYWQPDIFGKSPEIAVFTAIEGGITKHRLRYYQMEALFVLDELYRRGQVEKLRMGRPGYDKRKGDRLILDLVEEIDKEAGYAAPFIGYEMATGSGKTMLMGAAIYLLNTIYDVKNFLIIAPSSLDIYQKTIRNFTISGIESIWADDTPFTFNLTTGDDYTGNLFIDPNRDANIFVFNIDKFGAKAVKSEKAWESSAWKDEAGNTISIKDYLQRRKLVIITDEAHHSQGQKSMNIIKKFQPEAVLEFTATAAEKTKDEEKRTQTIVYKYDIRRFLEDGYGKLVRAVALADKQLKGRMKKESEVKDGEKLKLITLLLIHLVKKYGILQDTKQRGIKPVTFVKVKNDTPYTQKVYDYIRHELSDDADNLGIILDKAKAQDLEITSLIAEMIESEFGGDIEKLREAIRAVCGNSIFYHGASDKQTAKQFLEIRKNNVEIVVYMMKLDEGIDLPNIYSMGVVNDTATDFKTSVKQIIGRGVRLGKERREFDDEKQDLLKTQAEKLHVVCDQGKNFEEVIQAIQQEFGLTDKYLSYDKEKVSVRNWPKSNLLERRALPRIRAEFKVRPGVRLLDHLVGNIDGIVNNYLESNCLEGMQDTLKRFIKYRPESFFVEVDVFADKQIYHKQIKEAGGQEHPLEVTDKAMKDAYGIIQKNLPCLPDIHRVQDCFEAYRKKFNEIGLKFYKIDESDEKLCLKHFVHSFVFFYRNHIEKSYYELDFGTMEALQHWNLKTAFDEYGLQLPQDQVENDALERIKDEQKLLERIQQQFCFYGYKGNVYDYVKFDTLTEKKLADYIEILVGEDDNERPFWVRNERNVWFEYGNHRYYPDFLMYHHGILYVVEAKGEIYSDYRKNLLLAELDKYDGCKGVLVYSGAIDVLEEEEPNINNFISISSDFKKKFDKIEVLKKKPPDDYKFINFVPAYTTNKAYRKYVK